MKSDILHITNQLKDASHKNLVIAYHNNENLKTKIFEKHLHHRKHCQQ